MPLRPVYEDQQSAFTSEFYWSSSHKAQIYGEEIFMAMFVNATVISVLALAHINEVLLKH